MLIKKAFIDSIWVQRFRAKMEESLPPGFRFHPTDEELIAYYLNRKVSDVCFSAKAIAVVDLNKCEPWDLPGKASMGEKDWYFFSLRDRKYPTGMRTNRATEAGYWKTTGKDKEIYSSGGGGMLVGMKKTLVFYKGRAPRGEKSNWVMHEYRLENKHHYKPPKEEWVICRVFQKSSTGKKPNQTLDSLESPCNTNSIGGGHVELPSLIDNSLTNSLSGYNNIDANMMYPAAASDVPSLPFLGWPSNPSTLLGSNFSVNSLLLKALQLRSYQQRENHWNISDNYSCFRQGFSPFGNEMSSDFQASSSKSIENLTPQQEQPLNLDSIW